MSRADGLVDVFIVGQPKSGTTALASYLAQYQDICMAIPKEPNFFATDILTESDRFHGHQAHYHVRTPEGYRSLFKHDGDSTYLGEASADYLYSSEAAENIHAHNPGALIVASLREPVAMMWSLHREYLNEATEDVEDFLEALAREPRRKEGELVPKGARCPSLLHYAERIKYAEQLNRYLERYPSDRVIVVTAEELRRDSLAVCREVVTRLGGDVSFVPDIEAVHERKKPRFAGLNRVARSPRVTKVVHDLLGPQLYTRVQKGVAERVLLRSDADSGVPDTVREQLRDRVRPEVESVSELLDRDLVTEWGY